MPIEDLPNGNKLITDAETGAKIIFIAGPTLRAIIIDPNDYEPDTDEHINKQIEDYLIIKEYSK